MTKDEAIIELRSILTEATENEDSVSYVTENDAEVLEIAIKALEQEKVLDKIIDEVYDIDDEIVLNPDRLYERKTYVSFDKVIDIINKYNTESDGEE